MYTLRRLNIERVVEGEHARDRLIKQGYKEVDVVKEEEKEKTVEEMTTAELKAFAEAKEIDLGEAKKKEDILAVIKGGN